MRIPGLSFIIRFLPICLGIVGTCAVVFLALFAAMRAGRHIFDFGGETLRDNIRWFFTPRNFVVVGLLLMVLVAVIFFLAFAQYL